MTEATEFSKSSCEAEAATKVTKLITWRQAMFYFGWALTFSVWVLLLGVFFWHRKVRSSENFNLLSEEILQRTEVYLSLVLVLTMVVFTVVPRCLR